MVGTVIIVVVAILIPVAILAYFSHQRRSHERAALEDLWENYSNQGVDASVLPEDSPEALEQGEGSQKLVRFFFGGDIGYIQVKGLNYDLVTVRLALAPRSTSSVNIAGYHSTKQEIPISYHYIVPTRTVDDQTLRARLKKETKGLLRRELPKYGDTIPISFPPSSSFRVSESSGPGQALPQAFRQNHPLPEACRFVHVFATPLRPPPIPPAQGSPSSRSP